ncbi:uncharacterized protein L201_003219 [Kwoniella dendrophila CBS 6074]|uniref:Uncharacterized protein n=1 Tax=Kwoniella dendrophila CBS 6074 TaxID=1295534 RepID=A0AAX4JT17_9TREE
MAAPSRDNQFDDLIELDIPNNNDTAGYIEFDFDFGSANLSANEKEDYTKYFEDASVFDTEFDNLFQDFETHEIHKSMSNPSLSNIRLDGSGGDDAPSDPSQFTKEDQTNNVDPIDTILFEALTSYSPLNREHEAPLPDQSTTNTNTFYDWPSFSKTVFADNDAKYGLPCASWIKSGIDQNTGKCTIARLPKFTNQNFSQKDMDTIVCRNVYKFLNDPATTTHLISQDLGNSTAITGKINSVRSGNATKNLRVINLDGMSMVLSKYLDEITQDICRDFRTTYLTSITSSSTGRSYISRKMGKLGTEKITRLLSMVSTEICQHYKPELPELRIRHFEEDSNLIKTELIKGVRSLCGEASTDEVWGIKNLFKPILSASQKRTGNETGFSIQGNTGSKLKKRAS